MGTSRELGFSAAKILGAAVSAKLLEQAMVLLLTRSDRLGQLSTRRALLRRLESDLSAVPDPDRPGATAADELAHIVHRCAQDDQTGEKTDSLTQAVLAVTGDTEMVAQLRLLSDLNLARTRLTKAELSSLHDALANCDVDVHEVARTALAPFPPRLPDHCTDAWSVTLHLLRRNARPDGLPPFLAFLEYLAASLPDPADQQNLQQWSLTHATDRGLEESVRHCRAIAHPATNPQSSPPEPRIMFVLLPDGLDEEYCILRVWHQHDQMVKDDDVRVRQTDLQHAVRQRLAHWTTRKSARQMLVEFWLGLPLLNLPVGRWCMPEDSQGTENDLRVVVRSLHLRPDDTRSWRAHWSNLVDQNDASPTTSSPAEEHHDDTPQRRPLILAEPPDRKAGREQLLAALNQGVAAVMWDLGNSNIQDFRTHAERLFDEFPLAQLPERLAEVQNARDGSPRAEALQDAVLMWDDPTRDLPQLSPLMAPREVSSW